MSSSSATFLVISCKSASSLTSLPPFRAKWPRNAACIRTAASQSSATEKKKNNVYQLCQLIELLTNRFTVDLVDNIYLFLMSIGQTVKWSSFLSFCWKKYNHSYTRSRPTYYICLTIPLPFGFIYYNNNSTNVLSRSFGLRLLIVGGVIPECSTEIICVLTMRALSITRHTDGCHTLTKRFFVC